MHAKYKWLLLPPAIAVLLFFGPLRSDASTNPTTGSNPPEATTPANDAVIGGALPESPTMTEVASTLAGVILLGVVVVMVLSRFAKPRARPMAEGQLLAVRQTLRLSGKHTVHVVQFEDRLLLLGESEGHLNVLEEIPGAGASSDDAEIARRAAEELEDGAVPRNLVIPRPDHPPAARAKPRPDNATRSETELADFRTLLKLARAEAKAR